MIRLWRLAPMAMESPQSASGGEDLEWTAGRVLRGEEVLSFEEESEKRSESKEKIGANAYRGRIRSRSSHPLRFFGGAEGSRTPVQTYSSNAFYMFSFVLIVGVSRAETNLLHP